MTKRRFAAAALILLGFVIAALATLIPLWIPSETYWSEDQAREQAAAASGLHRATHQTAHAQSTDSASSTDKLQAEQQLAAAQARYDASRARLERAQFWRETVPRRARWLGGAIGLVGAIMYLSVSNR